MREASRSAPMATLLAVYAAKAIRTGAFGATAVILAPYLILHGFDAVQIGGILSATLIQDALLTSLVSAYAARIGLKRVLLFAALAISVSGIVLAGTSSSALIVGCIIFGIISPAGYEGGPFGPIEQTLLAADDNGDLTRKMSHYNLCGFAGAAMGAAFAALLTAGCIVRDPAAMSAAQTLHAHNAFGLVMMVYAASGLVMALLYGFLPINETCSSTAQRPTRAPLPAIKEGKRNIFWLAGLQSLDAFGGGFVVQALIAHWFMMRYGVDTAFVGTVFFWANIFAACSFFAAPSISKRFGLLNTIVFTHLPCSLALCAMPLMPTAWAAGALLLLRSFFSSMDIPARQAYSMLIVPVQDRPFAAGLTTSARAVSQAIAPAFSGWALANATLGLPFIIGGAVKSIYDMALYFRFKNIQPVTNDKSEPIDLALEKPAKLEQVASK